jgi:GntR family transcriptional repressor for pyruvate dehydrogenase complex
MNDPQPPAGPSTTTMQTLEPGPDYAIIQPTPERRLKRPDDIAERIKDLMVEQSLKPGDRLPGERDLMERFHASKSTVREALKALDTQGLIRARSGPGGGVFVAELSGSRAMELLGNYFFFRQPSIGDIYTVRVELEPELAASVVGRLTEDDFQRLQNTMRLYEKPPVDRGEEYRQRLAELDFHSELAELSPNPILGFICGFMHNLLRNLTICKQIYAEPNPELREQGLHYQVQLLRALRADDAEAARAIMREHMLAARAFMVECEASFEAGFLRLRDKPR